MHTVETSIRRKVQRQEEHAATRATEIVTGSTTAEIKKIRVSSLHELADQFKHNAFMVGEDPMAFAQRIRHNAENVEIDRNGL